MKRIVFAILSLTLSVQIHAQSQSVRDFVEGRYFKSDEWDKTIVFGYISAYNTYGITFINSEGYKSHFINCDIAYSSDKQYMELTNCFTPATGGTLGKIGVYKDRMILFGSDGNATFYLQR